MFGFIIVIILFISYAFYFSINQDNSNNEGNSPSQSTEDIVWGVDSAVYTNNDQLQCVKDNYGKPKIWGRYLGDKEDVSVGIDIEEIHLLHKEDIQLLLIYNHFSDATGYDNGVDHANKAISFAKNLDIPSDTAIFADIEPSFPVSNAFIKGWYHTLAKSEYNTGIYGVFENDSNLVKAYNASDEEAKENIVIWSAHPQYKITSKENAPEYNPAGPDSNKYGWQYGIEAKDCTIDTNLFTDEMLDYVW